MITKSINKSPRQNGFTVVELLVALALVLFIMSIISQVFVDASEAFRSARSKAELTEKLRFITQTLRADLRSRHFENGRKLSDSDFWKVGPPKAGYFRIEHKTNLPEYAPDGVTQISNSLGEPLISGNPTAGHVIAFTGFQNGQNANVFTPCSPRLTHPFWRGKTVVDFIPKTHVSKITPHSTAPMLKSLGFLGQMHLVLAKNFQCKMNLVPQQQ